MDQQQPVAAEPMISAGLASLKENYADDVRQIIHAKSLLGEDLTVLAQYPEAEMLLQQSLTNLVASQNSSAAAIRATRNRVHALYTAWDKPEKAEQHT